MMGIPSNYKKSNYSEGLGIQVADELPLREVPLCWESQQVSVAVEKLTIFYMVSAFKPQTTLNVLV